ncbi:Nn.00g114930.m01.CDS01 [Neocucurbitaria sp. VM-36]
MRKLRQSRTVRPTDQVIDITLGSATENQHARADTLGLSPGTTTAPTSFEAFRPETMIDDHWSPVHELLDFTDDVSIPIPTSEIMTTGFDDLIINAESTLTSTVPIPAIVAAPTHIPTTLIEYWFGRICPLRSTFDSGINYNRQVAWSTWSSSEAVSSTMQAMSAACLVGSMPQLKEILPSLRSQALTAVSLSLTRVQESSLPTITIDLIFAMLSLGTSLHWFAPASLSGSECSWSESARDLLLLWRPRLEAADALLYAYFSQALTYWDMLLAPVGRGSIPAKIRTKRRELRNRIVNALNLSVGYDDGIEGSHRFAEHVPDVLGTRPNSWCGVSSEVIYLYGHVLALCRSVSVRATDNNMSATERATDVLCDMSIARELQKELLALDFDILILLEETQGYPVVTQDHRTPVQHLLQTAEAFRKAALLQLHLTFEDLPVNPTLHAGEDIEHGANLGDHHSRKAYARTLAFRLGAILENMPVESGCRSIHPMLYLAVTVGLCNTTRPASRTAYQLNHDYEEHIGNCNTQPFAEQAFKGSSSLQDALRLEQHSLIDASPVDLQSAVSNARRMTLTRLSQLQQMLPHASSGQVLEVVKALWSAYDNAPLDNSNICWFKVARETISDTLLWS